MHINIFLEVIRCFVKKLKILAKKHAILWPREHVFPRILILKSNMMHKEQHGVILTSMGRYIPDNILLVAHQRTIGRFCHRWATFVPPVAFGCIISSL